MKKAILSLAFLMSVALPASPVAEIATVDLSNDVIASDLSTEASAFNNSCFATRTLISGTVQRCCSVSCSRDKSAICVDQSCTCTCQ